MAGRIDRGDMESIAYDGLPSPRHEAVSALVQSAAVAHEQERRVSVGGRRRPQDAGNVSDDEAAVDDAV
ncbi:conserved hypothetical protein [Aeromicrobium sp. 9AM]|nr:conserved hypothetical protein [Aeromicrobium sp. 9AM]